MEGISKPLIKDAETLKRQLALSNEAPRDDSKSTVSIPSGYKDYPLTELGEKVKELRQKPLEELNHDEYSLVMEYPLYVKNLRTVRKEQGNQIHDALEGAESEAERREAFLSSISWSGPIQEKILEEMESGGFSLDKRTLTGAQIEEASHTREGFVSILDMYVSLRPSGVIESLPKLSSLLNHDEMSHLIEGCVSKKPSLVALHHTQLSQFYGDNFKEVFIGAAKQSSDAAFVRLLASDAGLRSSIGEEQSVEITSAAIVKDLSVLDSFRNEEIWKSGLVNPTLINEVLAAKLPWYYEYRVVSFIGDIWPYLDATGKGICQGVMEKRLHSDDHSYLDFRSYEGIIDEDVLREKARSILLSSTAHPIVTIKEMKQLEQYLSPTELRQWIEEYLNGGKELYRLGSSCSEDIMQSDTFTEQEKMLLVRRLLRESPRQVFGDPDTFLSLYTPEERQRTMVQLGGESSGWDGIRMLPEWLPYTTSSVEEQKTILIEHCLKDSDLSFLEWYQDQTQNEPYQTLFRSLISKSDLITIIEKKAEVETSAVLRKTGEIRAILGGDENLKQLVDRLCASTPLAFFESIDKVAYLYTPLELEIIIWEHIGTFKYGHEIFKHINVWGPRLGTEKTDEICEAHMDTLCLTASGLEAYIEMHPDRSITDFVPILMKTNPVAALYFLHGGDNMGIEYRNAGVSISPEEIRDTARIDARTSPLSKSLEEFWSSLNISNIAESGLDLVAMKRALFIYVHKAELTRAGLGETLARVLSAEAHDAHDEQRVFQNLVSYMRLQRMGATDSLSTSKIETAEDIEQALFSGMVRLLNDNAEINESERAAFLSTMETPGPFVSYLAQYNDSPEHKKLLASMFNSITDGTYILWKYGRGEEFEVFRKDGLLPSETSQDQYEIWKADEQTALFETLKATGEEVAEHLKRLLVQNSMHLGVHNFEESVKEPATSLNEVKQELKLLGPRLAEIGKQVSLLSKDPETPEEMKRSVQAEKAKLEQLRNILTRNRDIIRLVSITPEEVMSGYFIEAGKRVQSIDTFLRGMRDRVPSEGQFVIDQIITQLGSLRTQGVEKENIQCEDTSDPKITLEVGAVPVESCQHYESGSYNECLLGYTEPNTKVLVVRNGKGNIIARSILRLLSAEGGAPALHVEQIYTSSAGVGVKRSIFEHAFRKAVSLDVPLVANAEDVPTDFNFKIGEEIELTSKGSRAPKVYVDSAGGSKSWGNYRIRGGSIITRSK
jgi:hypothetical protein